MKQNILKHTGILLFVAIVGLSSCSKNNDSANQVDPVQSAAAIKLVTDSKFGSVITDRVGNVLYFFAIDAGITSGCSGGCSVTWPTFYTAEPTVGTGLLATDFGVITRADGSKQTTYKGWPLYTYSGDSKPGDINGDAVGKTWFVAKPDYTVMLVNKQLVGKDGIEYTSQYVPGKETVQYITDDYGRTLYSFKNDKAKTNTFTKPDLSNNVIWPIMEVSAVKNVPSTLSKASFEIITAIGKTQLVYKGWPLYTFGEDGGVRGNNKGVSIGPGVWPVTTINTIAAP
jgi:predicted lipoprotein with Yx(FWY)xxD motif